MIYHLTIIHSSIHLPIHPYLSIIIYHPPIHYHLSLSIIHPSKYHLVSISTYHLSVIYPCTYPSVFSSICLSVHPSCMYLSIHPPSVFTHSFIHLSIFLFVHVHLSSLFFSKLPEPYTSLLSLSASRVPGILSGSPSSLLRGPF